MAGLPLLGAKYLVAALAASGGGASRQRYLAWPWLAFLRNPEVSACISSGYKSRTMWAEQRANDATRQGRLPRRERRLCQAVPVYEGSSRGAPSHNGVPTTISLRRTVNNTRARRPLLRMRHDEISGLRRADGCEETARRTYHAGQGRRLPSWTVNPRLHRQSGQTGEWLRSELQPACQQRKTSGASGVGRTRTRGCLGYENSLASCRTDAQRDLIGRQDLCSTTRTRTVPRDLSPSRKVEDDMRVRIRGLVLIYMPFNT